MVPNTLAGKLKNKNHLLSLYLFTQQAKKPKWDNEKLHWQKIKNIGFNQYQILRPSDQEMHFPHQMDKVQEAVKPLYLWLFRFFPRRTQQHRQPWGTEEVSWRLRHLEVFQSRWCLREARSWTLSPKRSLRSH